MIYSLNGKLIYSDAATAVVECGGVGYKCNVSLKTVGALPGVGENVLLYTYMAVREDAVDLFGFITLEELHCFKLLISVNGVGAKVGIAILSEFTPDFVLAYISSGDYKALTSAAGVGPKLAQRIVLELKDKVGALGINPTTLNVGTSAKNDTAMGNLKSASAALLSLGFIQSEANRALSGLDASLPTEELIKQALARISAGKY
jgi:Holliday junction DNA helicase RuvA